MGEVLGQAVLELRTDDSALTGGISKARAEAEGLQSTFNRAGDGVASSLSTAGVAASRMATEAQASGRAAMGMAAGFEASAGAARLNTIAMRETLVVARELARGNFTRIPGSLTLLAANTTGGLSGFISGLTQSLGLVKTLQNAELAEEATNAAAAAEAVRTAAQVAAAKVMAADAQLALAEAAVRTAEGADAEAAAQARLARAHITVAAAASEATIAEDALASAQAAASEAGAAAAAESVTSVSALGAALGLTAIGGGLLAAALLEAKDAAEEADPSAKNFISTLGLTRQEIKRLKDETVTWGDVGRGTLQALEDAAGISSSAFESFWHEAFLETAQVGVSAAQVIAGAFAAVASVANNLKNVGLAIVNPSLGGGLLAGGVPGPEKIGQDALNAFEKQFSATGNFFHGALPAHINAARDARLRGQANKLIGDRTPKNGRAPKSSSDGASARSPIDDELNKLNAQITGQDALASAYLVSDAAAVKAEAHEKALTLAIEKHATAAQAAALEEKELALAIATGSAQGAKHVADLNFEADARKTVNDMVAAGLIPESQANEQLQLENELRPLLALRALAHGDALARLNRIIQQTTASQAKLNAETSREQALKGIAANDDEIAKLQLENSLMGVSNSERAAAIAQLEAIQKLATMPGLSPAEQAAFVNSEVAKALAGIQTPFQQWAQSIPQDAKAITEAFQGIEVRGIDGLSSGIAGVISGTESLKQAFSSLAQSVISDIVQMIVKMLIFRALSSLFGGIPSPDISSPMSMNLPLAQPLAHLAGGGFMSIGGNGGVDRNLLSINGQPRAMVGADETLAVIPSGGGLAASSNQPARIELIVSGDDLWKLQVGHVANAVVDLKTPGIVGQARKATMGSIYKKPI